MEQASVHIRNYKCIYFIGIGGIGMSALARYFHLIGKKIAGYDRTETPLTKELEALGISIHYSDDLEQLTGEFKDPDSTMVVYTPAVPESHQELRYFRESGLFY